MQLIKLAMERARQADLAEALPGAADAGVAATVVPHAAGSIDRAAPGFATSFAYPPPVVPGLATPRRVPFDREQARRARVVLPDDDSPAAHALRMLRAQLHRTLQERSIRTIGFVSPQAGAGATLAAANLALCFAADPEHAVTLLELDLRTPGLRQLFGVEAQEVGFDDYLRGAATLEEAAFAFDDFERLQVLAVRDAGSVTAGLAVTERLQSLFRGARLAPPGQLLFVDLPPVLASEEVLTVARGLDAIVVVGFEGRTRRDELGTTLRLLRNLPVLCGVLNGASAGTRGVL